MSRILRTFMKRYAPTDPGALSRVGLGDARFDEKEQAAAAERSPLVTIESGVFSGTSVVRESAAEEGGPAATP